MRTQIYNLIKSEYEKAGNKVVDQVAFEKNVDWYLDNDLAALAVDDTDTVWAIGLARRLDSVEQIPEHFTNTEAGGIVSVDFVYGQITEDIEILFDQLLARFPGVQYIAFQRELKSDSRVRLFRVSKVRALLKLLGTAGP